MLAQVKARTASSVNISMFIELKIFVVMLELPSVFLSLKEFIIVGWWICPIYLIEERVVAINPKKGSRKFELGPLISSIEVESTDRHVD